MIEKNMKGAVEETILETVDLLDNIRNDPNKFTLKLENELEEYAAKHNKCSMCGQDLQIKEFNESREYQGFSCKEPIYKEYCPQHGYVD